MLLFKKERQKWFARDSIKSLSKTSGKLEKIHIFLMFLTVFHRFNPFLERIVPVALFLKSERERIALYKILTVSN